MDFTFLLSFTLVLITLIYSYREKLDLEREILFASFRAFVQLTILGFSLVYILEIKNLFILISILVFMNLFGAYTAQQRLKLKHNGVKYAFWAIFLGSAPVLLILTLLGIITTEAYQIIPIGGMVIGNALNVYTLAVNKIKGDVENSKDIIECKLAVGASLKEALGKMLQKGIKSSLIPILNNLRTVGVIFIPGVTTGLLLAGTEPLKAVSYQLVIMYMMVAISLLTSFFTTIFLYKTILWEVD